MTTVAAVTGGLALLALVVLAAVAIRRPLLAKIAYRQVVRRPGQALLMVLGMTFASGAIMAVSGLSDITDTTNAYQVQSSWGAVDLTVRGAGRMFDPAVAGRLAADPAVRSTGAKVTGGVDLVGTAGDLNRGATAPALQVIGVDGPTMAPFGRFHLTDGRVVDVARLAPGHAMLSEFPAGRLGARAGDRVRVSLNTGGRQVRMDVVLDGIARAEGAGAYGVAPGVFVPLADLQHALGTGDINVVRVTVPSRDGSELDAATHAVPAFRRALAGIPGAARLEVREAKREDLTYTTDPNGDGAGGMRPILVLVSFLVVLAGTAVVVNLNLATAEERRPRLAVLRALGLSRGAMIVAGMLESALYGIAGSVLGVLPGIAYATYEALFKGYPANDAWATIDLPGRFTISTSSVVFASAVGIVVSLATVLVTSVRTSRMTISSAVKDLPEPPPLGRRSWLRRGWVAALALAGVASLAAPVPVLRDLGGALVLVAAAAAVRGLVPERARATVAGAALAAWGLGYLALGPSDPNLPFGTALVAVALGVLGLALAASANLAALEALVATGSSRLGATLRPPLAYLTRRPIRTGLTTGTFGLVLAGLTVFSVFLGSSLPTRAQAGWDVVLASSGDEALTVPASARGDVAAEYVMRTATLVEDIRDGSGLPRQTLLVVVALTDRQLENPPIQLAGRDGRYPSDAAVWRAMRDDPTLAVASNSGGVTPPFTIDTGPASSPVTFRTAALATTPLLGWSSNWIIVSERALRLLPSPALGTLILLRGAHGVSPASLAAAIRPQATGAAADVWTADATIAGAVASQTWWVTTFFSDLFDVGLVVGVLSLAVMALRAVVERRRSIGVLRALGYQPRRVLLALVLEALLLTSIGVATGLLVGLVAGYLFVTSPSSLVDTTGFAVQVPRLLAPVGLVYVAVLLATVWPALRASRLPAAEALRIVG